VEISPIETSESDVVAPSATQVQIGMPGGKKKRKRH